MPGENITEDQIQYDYFISWSKDSKDFAKTLESFISALGIGTAFCSDTALKAGDDWDKKILDALESCKVAIFCITEKNKKSPWIYLECGAIYYKGIKDKEIKLCPVLINTSKNFKFPIPTKQAVKIVKSNHQEKIREIIRIIDESRGDNAYKNIDGVFDKHWLTFENNFLEEIKKISSSSFTSSDNKAEIEEKPSHGGKLLNIDLTPENHISNSGELLENINKVIKRRLPLNHCSDINYEILIAELKLLYEDENALNDLIEHLKNENLIYFYTKVDIKKNHYLYLKITLHGNEVIRTRKRSN